MISLKKYKTIIFDCDGVILNSNKLKTQTFFDVSLHYGKLNAKKLVDYHKKHGGISRYEKFKYFLSNIIKTEVDKKVLDNLLKDYSVKVSCLLGKCEVSKGIFELRKKTFYSNWMVVSGGNQEELRNLFENKSLKELFDLGIYGSPDSKETILKREIKYNNIKFPALYLGDSKYDYQCSIKNGIDFIFISKWTDFMQWKKYCDKNNINHIKKLSDLLNS